MITRPTSFVSATAIAALVLFAVTGQVRAASATETPGIVDAYNAEQVILQQFQSGNVAEPSQQALNILVARGVSLLAENGEAPLAAQFEQEWQNTFTNYLPEHIVSDSSQASGFTILDIGDHDPLSPWLAKFHDTLAAKTNGVIDGIPIIYDIFTMNYALGVVLHPKLKTWKSGETQADEWEYRKHFIPMANIVTYWTVLEACNYVAATKFPAAKQFCSPAADKLKFLMGRYWAPKLSDVVYEKANGFNCRSLSFSGSRMFTLSEPEFEQEILNTRI